MKRCVYCGHRCHGRTCQYCKDLARIEREALSFDQYRVQPMRDDLKATKGKVS